MGRSRAFVSAKGGIPIVVTGEPGRLGVHELHHVTLQATGETKSDIAVRDENNGPC
jgi:hypothetical protein